MYAVVVFLGAAVVTRIHRGVGLSTPTLWGLVAFGLGHLAGGMVPVGDGVPGARTFPRERLGPLSSGFSVSGPPYRPYMGSKTSGAVTEHPSGSPLSELAWAITSGAVRLAAATAAWLRLVAEFDERGGWHGIGIHSCAHWLAWQCGLGPGAAREHVRVAKALRALPRIEAAFAAGRLSYSKVRALTRVATADCEAALLDFAVHATASQTERFCRTWRRVDDQDGPRSAQADVTFEYSTDDDGSFTLRVRGPAEAGAALMSRIESLAEREYRRERALAKKAAAEHARIRAAGGVVDTAVEDRCADDDSAGLVRERRAARRFAALTSLADARVDVDRRPGDPPRREVVVHVDAAVLADDSAAGQAYVEGGPPIPAAAARRMLCEATVVTMLESGREPLAVGRRKRRATRAQRRALLRRDGGCARPGCPETRIERLHAHHMRHWLFGGRTELANLVLLCDADHGLVHDHDLIMARADGRLIITAADGRHVWGAADATFTAGLNGLTGAPADRATDPAFAGIQPIDDTIGRRPVAHRGPSPRRPAGRPLAPTAPGARRVNRRPSRTLSRPARVRQQLDAALFPGGAPDLPGTLQDHSHRMDLRYAIGVLMGNRDLARRLAAETGVQLAHIQEAG